MLSGKRKASGETSFRTEIKKQERCQGENCEIKSRINQPEAGQERAFEDLI